MPAPSMLRSTPRTSGGCSRGTGAVTAARIDPLPSYATILPYPHRKAKTYESIFNDYETYASIFDYPKRKQRPGRSMVTAVKVCTNPLYGYGKKTFLEHRRSEPDHGVQGLRYADQDADRALVVSVEKLCAMRQLQRLPRPRNLCTLRGRVR